MEILFSLTTGGLKDKKEGLITHPPQGKFMSIFWEKVSRYISESPLSRHVDHKNQVFVKIPLESYLLGTLLFALFV